MNFTHRNTLWHSSCSPLCFPKAYHAGISPLLTISVHYFKFFNLLTPVLPMNCYTGICSFYSFCSVSLINIFPPDCYVIIISVVMVKEAGRGQNKITCMKIPARRCSYKKNTEDVEIIINFGLRGFLILPS